MMVRPRKLEDEWRSLKRRRDVKYEEISGFAGRLGRIGRKKQGGDRVYVSGRFPELRGVTIPDHSGTIPLGTKNAILKALWADVQRLKEGQSGTPDSE